MGISYSDHLDLQTDIRAKLVTYAIFGFLGPYKNTHAITPWFQGIAQRPRNHLEAHCKDSHFSRSNFIFWMLFRFKLGKYSFSTTPTGAN
jgi:hypothetical protein